MISVFTKSNQTFEGKRENEEVRIFLNRHWITIFLRLLGLGIVLLFPIIPLFALSGIIVTYHLESLVFFLLVLFYMLIWSGAFFSITMYLLDTWIVTEERVLDMTQHGFFSRTVSEMPLSKIQDISIKIEGLIPTMFNYGNVEIQSAGTVDKFTFKQVGNPSDVKNKLMELVKSARNGEAKNGL